MKEKIAALLEEIEQFNANTLQELEAFKNKMVAKKGIINLLFEEFKTLPPEQRKEAGKYINNLKNKATEKIQVLSEKLSNKNNLEYIDDLTATADSEGMGSRHPISIVRRELINIFSRIGFVVSEGPEIEDDKHVFSALNFPPDHPARDMQDSFYIEMNPEILLRTHTSSVQIRVMEKTKPPIRIIMPGRVFRNEAISVRSHCIFHQIEGLYIDKNVSFADLKQTLLYFAKELFGENTKIRLRPSFFPFTEPSAEMDVSCSLCGGKGCALCKYSGWLEILGCGMVHPNVLDNCGIDSKQYSGFAFGMGIERITMLKYQVKDIRLFFENDVRFLNQFSSAF